MKESFSSHENYKVINMNNKNRVCYVFFSSNGIINDKKSLNDILLNDYYEFSNVADAKKIKERAGKMIFVRDLSLNFFVDGINNSVNSIDSILELLNKETEGYDVISVGYSAGGYMAIITALYLKNVKRVFSFGGVFNVYSWRGSHLETRFELNKTLVLNKNNLAKEKYYNLLATIKNTKISRCEFYCFYAKNSVSDIEVLNEAKLAKLPSCFHLVVLDSKKHGGQLSYYDYVGLLSKKLKFRLVFKNKVYNKNSFSIKAQGLIPYYLNRVREWRYRKGGEK